MDNNIYFGYYRISAENFKALVRKNRPNVTEEQLLGDTYDAADVVGTLVDGQMTFGECVDRLLEISGYTFAEGLLVPTAAVSSNDNEETENRDINSKPNYDMSKEYPLIMAAVQAPALESDKEDAVYLTKEFCENLEGRLAAAEEMEKAFAESTAELDALTEKLSTIETAHAEAIEKMTAEHADAIEKMACEHAEAMENLKAEHEAVVTELTANAAANAESMKKEHEAIVADLNAKLEAATSAIAEKEAEIVELAEQPAANAKGEAPVDNASTVATKVRESITAVKPGMTAKERREALKRTEERLRRTV